MQNPHQWSSFENLSVWYAELSLKRIEALSVPVILLQRWWRQRKLPRNRQMIYPIKSFNGRWAHSVRNCVKALRDQGNDPMDLPILASEKLDGTNLGIRCDGAVFGRRLQLEGTSYQRTPLQGAIPKVEVIKSIKEAIRKAIRTESTEELPKLLLYGELMCNPNRYGYRERGMDKTWECFGALFAPHTHVTESTNEMLQKSETLKEQLLNAGFAATVSRDKGIVTLRLSETLLDILRTAGARVVPIVDSGSLFDVCTRQKGRMMGEDLEGLVLSGPDFLKKWKTGTEDESKGSAGLSSILKSYSSAVLRLANVNEEFLGLLADVAGNKPKTTGKSSRKTRKEKSSVYDQAVLQKAMESALSKYDSLDNYFSRGERGEILASLKKELVEDLGASNIEQVKGVEGFVAKHIGVSFGAWKRENAPK